MVIGFCLFLQFSSVSARFREFPVHRFRFTNNLYLLKREASVLGTPESTEFHMSLEMGNPPQKIDALIDTRSADFSVSTHSNENVVNFDPSGSVSFFEYEIPQNDYAENLWAQNCVSQGKYGSDLVWVNGLDAGRLDFAMTDKLTKTAAVCGLGFRTPDFDGVCQNWNRPSLMDMLKQNGEIQYAAYSMWLNDHEKGEGSILFGGINLSRVLGTMVRLPLVPSNSGIIDSFTVSLGEILYVSEAEKSYVLSRGSLPVLFDVSSTFSYLPYHIIEPLYEVIGALPVSTESTVQCSTIRQSGSISLSFSGAEFVFPLSKLFKPKDSFGVTCVPAFLPGINAVIGDNILRYLYVVYDLENRELGVAVAKNESEIEEPEFVTFSTAIYGEKAPNYTRDH